MKYQTIAKYFGIYFMIYGAIIFVKSAYYWIYYVEFKNDFVYGPIIFYVGNLLYKRFK